MEDNKSLAIEIAQSLIQNKNIKPTFDESLCELKFNINGSLVSFNLLVDLLINELELINKW